MVVGVVFICKHGLHRTTLHRSCYKLEQVDHFIHAQSLGPPLIPRGFPSHCASVTVFRVFLNTEEDVSVYFGSRKYNVARRCQCMQ